mmetsp:Transcript_41950/g.91495  ORF Transcript_41950/g.91495 Transcript_41950/m.91495 type:complete len:267 (-) Transcript_41950:181-981(-)
MSFNFDFDKLAKTIRFIGSSLKGKEDQINEQNFIIDEILKGIQDMDSSIVDMEAFKTRCHQLDLIDVLEKLYNYRGNIDERFDYLESLKEKVAEYDTHENKIESIAMKYKKQLETNDYNQKLIDDLRKRVFYCEEKLRSNDEVMEEKLKLQMDMVDERLLRITNKINAIPIVEPHNPEPKPKKEKKKREIVQPIIKEVIVEKDPVIHEKIIEKEVIIREQAFDPSSIKIPKVDLSGYVKTDELEAFRTEMISKFLIIKNNFEEFKG